MTQLNSESSDPTAHPIADSTAHPTADSTAVSTADVTGGSQRGGGPSARRWKPTPIEWFILGLGAFLLGQHWLVSLFSAPAWQAGATVFVAIVVQALPFLVLGVVLSGVITAYVSPAFFARVLPKNPALAVPVAGAAGVLIPGCECASVPVAGGLMARGVTPAAALAFLLSSPAINPVVIVSTFVAFPNNHMMALARLVASLIAAVVMGWVWLFFGRGEWLRIPQRDHLVGSTKFETFWRTAAHDFLHAGGFLVIGGITAAILNVVIPPSWLQAVSDRPLLSIVGLSVLAVVLCICSEADAFVAASLTQFSLTARLAFLVVGPMVDIKLVALQIGTFGRAFAMRFAPVTFVVAMITAALVGWWLV